MTVLRNFPFQFCRNHFITYKAWQSSLPTLHNLRCAHLLIEVLKLIYPIHLLALQQKLPPFPFSLIHVLFLTPTDPLSIMFSAYCQLSNFTSICSLDLLLWRLSSGNIIHDWTSLPMSSLSLSITTAKKKG